MSPLEASAALLQPSFISRLCLISASIPLPSHNNNNNNQFIVFFSIELSGARPLRFPRPTKTSCIFVIFASSKEEGFNWVGLDGAFLCWRFRPFFYLFFSCGLHSYALLGSFSSSASFFLFAFGAVDGLGGKQYPDHGSSSLPILLPLIITLLLLH